MPLNPTPAPIPTQARRETESELVALREQMAAEAAEARLEALSGAAEEGARALAKAMAAAEKERDATVARAKELVRAELEAQIGEAREHAAVAEQAMELTGEKLKAAQAVAWCT